jgi:hypothetical protein
LRDRSLALPLQQRTPMRLVLPFTFAAIAAATITAHAQPPPEFIRAQQAQAAGLALAEPDPPSKPGLGVPIAFAVNVPFAWPWSLAFSSWVGVDEHHAVRVSYARYRGPLWKIIPGMLESEGPEAGDLPADFGHTTDVSVGWVYFSRRVLDGATLEVGALLRLNRLRDRIDNMNVASEEQRTNVYGVRGLAGWTWRLSDWWFVGLSVGASAGYERGQEKVFVGYDFSHSPPDIIRAGPVSRIAWSGEAYLRVGMAFGQ